MAEGWFKMSRQVLHSDVWDNHNAFRLFFYILASVAHSPLKRYERGNSVALKPGEMIYGRRNASAVTGLSERQVRTAMAYLEKTDRVARKTTHHFSIVTVCNWDTYQNKNGQSDPQNDPDLSRTCPGPDPDLTTIQELKNDKNEKKVLVDGEKNEESPAAILRRLQSIQLEQIRIRTTGVNFESELNKWSDHVIFNQQEDRPPKALLAGFRRWLRQAEEWNQQGRNKNQNNIERQSDGF